MGGGEINTSALMQGVGVGASHVGPHINSKGVAMTQKIRQSLSKQTVSSSSKSGGGVTGGQVHNLNHTLNLSSSATGRRASTNLTASNKKGQMQGGGSSISTGQKRLQSAKTMTTTV